MRTVLRTRPDRSRRSFAGVLAVVLALSVPACSGSDSPTRSEKSFCDTYNSEKAKFQSKYASLESGPAPQTAGGIIANLLLGFQSLGDATVILTKLEKVAPNDIEPDVAAVLESWKSVQGTLGDEATNALNPRGLVGVVLRGLITSAESGGSWTRVGNYVQQHCLSGQ